MNEGRLPCPHCAELILPAAKFCPHCRKRLPQPASSAIVWALGIFVAVFIVWMVVAGLAPVSPPPSAVQPVARLDKSPAAEARRKALIEKLIREGIFQKIETPGNLPRLWVRSAFHELDFDQKKTFVEVVYAYYFDGSDRTEWVRIFDSQTGKEIGGFNPHLYPNGGLKLE